MISLVIHGEVNGKQVETSVLGESFRPLYSIDLLKEKNSTFRMPLQKHLQEWSVYYENTYVYTTIGNCAHGACEHY